MRNDGKQFEAHTEEVFRILSAMDRATIVQRDVKLPGADGPRQIDVLVRAKVANLDIITIIECRDKGGRLDVTNIDGLHSKMQDVRANKAVLVSRRGFSKTAVQKAARLGITLCTLNNPNSELKNVGLEVPIALTEAAIENIAPSYSLKSEIKTIVSVDAAMMVNDLNLMDLVCSAFLAGNVPIPDHSQKLSWLPSNLHTPYFIRDQNGTKLEITSLDVKIQVSIRHYFGYASQLPGFLLDNISDKKTEFIFKIEDILKAFPKLPQFNNPSEFPKVPSLFHLIGIKEPVVEGAKGQLQITNSETGQNFHFPFQNRFENKKL